jgi:hypothetical protein
VFGERWRVTMMTVRTVLDRLLAELEPEDVRSLLLRLRAELETDLTADGVDDFYREMTELPPDEDALLDAEIDDQGQRVPVLFEFFRHVDEADELLVVATPAIVAHVQGEIERLVATPKLRVIHGE